MKAGIVIRGRQHEWSLSCDVSMRAINAMREDGVDVSLIVNTVPLWVAACGLTTIWCAIQDVWNLRSPFAR